MLNTLPVTTPVLPRSLALNAGATFELHMVESGPALLDYLPGSSERAYLPALILVDASRASGVHAATVAALKADPRLRAIPVVLFTTSRAQAEVSRVYNLNGSTYRTRAIPFGWLPELLQSLHGQRVVIVSPASGSGRPYTLGGDFYLARPAQSVHWMDLLRCLGRYWSYELVEVASRTLAA